MKAFAEDNLKVHVLRAIVYVFDRVENIVGKGDNAGYHHFLLFPKYFQKPSCQRSLKAGTVWEQVQSYAFYNLSLGLNHKIVSHNDPVKKLVGKEENVGNQSFFSFPTLLLNFERQILSFEHCNIQHIVYKCFRL